MIEHEGPVVVGYDGSIDADWAVDWAAAEAGRRGRPLLVIFATDLSGLYRPEVTTGQHNAYFQRMAEAVAEGGALRARAAAPGVSVETRTTGLGAAAALQEASAQASLLVVGGRGRSKLSDALLGTVQFAVTAHAECPVVVVPPDTEMVVGPEHPVVVGVDGSDGSDRSLRAAAQTASRRGASLVMVGAWERSPVDDWSRYYLVDGDWRDEVFAVARATAARSVSAAGEIVNQEYPGLETHEVVMEGRPSTVLANESVTAGLIFVGARGRGDLASLVLGSVSRQLIHITRCPVAVIR